jgi:hypothetical protein
VDTGYSQEEPKSKVVPCGWAVAASGNSRDAIRYIFGKLEEDWVTPENVQNRVTDFLDECRRVRKIDVKSIVVAAHEGKVEAYLVETSEFGAFATRIDTPFRCEGERTEGGG